MTIETINPATGKLIKRYEEMSAAEVFAIIDSTSEAAIEWKQFSFKQRAKHMNKAADILEKNSEAYAKIISEEMGKPITAARAEIKKCAWVCHHYAEHAEDYLQPNPVKTEMSKSYVTYRPLGIVFAIMPWNFPFWQVFRFAAPTLMAGNAGLLKHAPISTGAGLAIENIFAEANFPKNLFRTLIIDNECAAKVIAHPKIAAVTLTGSSKAGSIVGREAASNLKKIVLELGGSDPYVICRDADLEEAASAVAYSRMNNSGQVCIAAKRVIIPKKIKDKFMSAVTEKINAYRMGDPAKDETNFGPLARRDIRDEVHHQVAESISKGATLVMGGQVPERDGFYYPPTILSDVKPGMPAYEEEIFGPVLSVIEVEDEEEAIRVANDTSYGLAGAVFTKDLAKGERIAAQMIEAGSVAVNTFVASDPRLPFGGIKGSGYGRELGAEGILAFVNVKTISIK